MKTKELTAAINTVATAAHRALGPGLLEPVHQVGLEKKPRDAGLEVERQVAIPDNFRGLNFKEAFRVDPFVEKRVVPEIKAIEAIAKVHKRQLLTYLRLSDARVGLLLNFVAAVMRDGVTRVVNDFDGDSQHPLPRCVSA